MATQRIKLKELQATVKTQTRAELNPETLADYKEHCKLCKAKGVDPGFPPLVAFANPLDGEAKPVLSSGYTRRAALLATGFDEYDVDVRDSDDPKRDAVKFGFTANAEHGARLTNADKKHNMMLALEDAQWKELSNNALADLLGVSEGYIRQHRPVAAKPAVVKTKKGKAVATGNIGKKTGSARKAKAATKAATKKKGKAATAPTGDAAPDAPKVDAAFEAALGKIALAIHGHGFNKDEFIASVRDGSLPLSHPDIKNWAQKGDDRIRQMAPLIIEQRWTIGKAVGFLDKVPTGDTKAEHFQNLAIAHGGLVQEKVGDTKCIWFNADEYTVGETQDGVITITPKNKKGAKKK